jgi:hypothetical protein
MLVLAISGEVIFYNLSAIDPASTALPNSSKMFNFTTPQFTYLYTGIKVISECYIIVSSTAYSMQYNYKTNRVYSIFQHQYFNSAFPTKF